MLRFPAVAGRFYPANPQELAALVRRLTNPPNAQQKPHVKACLVPHAGYIYSGQVAGAVFAKIHIPRNVVILGVRHFPRGADAAIRSEGAWRTPLGDVQVNRMLAAELKRACPRLVEDTSAHEQEHSLEVQLPFLQLLQPDVQIVPIALGTLRLEDLESVGAGISRVVTAASEEILVVTSTDLNHYEDEKTTQKKDALAIAQLEAMNAGKLYDVCRTESISMCGLGPAVALLVALKKMQATRAEVVQHATSAAISGDYSRVVGYAGMIFD
ncbi:MAG TPA: AmmeMemoRadiSam system protein B [Candidatus Dormibacteraeota bacterium]|nr:AmmeMemoRadiSam system protein B [Candidatus Dormibacteraeota bacterium]